MVLLERSRDWQISLRLLTEVVKRYFPLNHKEGKCPFLQKDVLCSGGTINDSFYRGV